LTLTARAGEAYIRSQTGEGWFLLPSQYDGGYTGANMERPALKRLIADKAVCRLHSFGLALHQLRRCSWTHPDHSGVQRMTVEVLERWSPQQRIAVAKKDFDAWLETKQESFHEEKARKYLRMLLGLDQPDRDFKRGLHAR
jgi:hypothetical protein